MTTLKNKNGFTLIELLVVIAIISLLSTLALITLQNSRRDARNAKRRADIATIQSALQLYYNDHNEYPTNGCTEVLPGKWQCVSWSTDPYWIPDLSNYMTPPPRDPGGHQNQNLDIYVYQTNASEQAPSTIVHDFVLYFFLEGKGGPQQENFCNIPETKFDPGPLIFWSTRCPD